MYYFILVKLTTNFSKTILTPTSPFELFQLHTPPLQPVSLKLLLRDTSLVRNN